MERSKSAHTMARYRFPEPETLSDDHVECTECSTQTCQACSAFVMADCIALCCCPCSVVHLLAFSFVKAPYLVGRRCLKILSKKRKFLQKRVRDVGEGEMVANWGYKGFEESEESGELGVVDLWGLELGEYKNLSSSNNGRLSGKLDAEKIWMDLYQVGHWGFGRISFSTTNPLGGIGNGLGGKDVGVVYQNLKDLKDE